jgi:hypothetical protein
VWVKILEVRPEEGPRGGGFKLAASMKAVSQEDGTDLDPDNLMAAGGWAMGEKPRALVLVHCCRSHIEIPKRTGTWLAAGLCG